MRKRRLLLINVLLLLGVGVAVVIHFAIRERTKEPGAATADSAANARMTAMQAALAAGDVSAVLFAARSAAIKDPASAPAGDAVAVVQSLTSLAPDRPIKLTPRERLERAVSFLRDGDAQNCFDEIAFMEELGLPADLKLPLPLNKGLAL